MNIKELCAIHGAANIRVQMTTDELNDPFPRAPLFVGPRKPELVVEVGIDERHYQVSAGYKVGFTTINHGDRQLAPSAMYQADFNNLARAGIIKVRVVNMDVIA